MQIEVAWAGRPSRVRETCTSFSELKRMKSREIAIVSAATCSNVASSILLSVRVCIESGVSLAFVFKVRA